jgi:hypothetical protein
MKVRAAKTLIFLFFFLTFLNINAQKILNQDSLLCHVNELRENFGKNKKYPKPFELACLVALSHFPELKDVKIEFKYKSIGKHSMEAQPTADFFLDRYYKRTYKILINSKSQKKLGYSIEALSFNQMVGIFGHELSHILQYQQRRNLGLIIFLLSYLTTDFSKKVEFEADIIAIKHGLGWQVYDFVNYILNNANLDKIYRNKKLKDYYSEKDILEFMK